MKKKPLTDESGEVRELTKEDMKRFRPAKEALPKILGEKTAAELLKRKPGRRGPQKLPTKESVTVRYSREVLEYFRSTGNGWQSRMDEALREWVEQHRAKL
ncbi:MAG: hypothetical protein A4E69_00319 [Syntrophus sp. PtaB.Bin138]|nr:MAG: hypothetical protein A4E69_00319 [Syntrophus sp. PtaB.Bin138]